MLDKMKRATGSGPPGPPLSTAETQSLISSSPHVTWGNLPLFLLFPPTFIDSRLSSSSLNSLFTSDWSLQHHHWMDTWGSMRHLMWWTLLSGPVLMNSKSPRVYHVILSLGTPLLSTRRWLLLAQMISLSRSLSTMLITESGTRCYFVFCYFLFISFVLPCTLRWATCFSTFIPSLFLLFSPLLS